MVADLIDEPNHMRLHCAEAASWLIHELEVLSKDNGDSSALADCKRSLNSVSAKWAKHWYFHHPENCVTLYGAWPVELLEVARRLDRLYQFEERNLVRLALTLSDSSSSQVEPNLHGILEFRRSLDDVDSAQRLLKRLAGETTVSRNVVEELEAARVRLIDLDPYAASRIGEFVHLLRDRGQIVLPDFGERDFRFR